MDDLPFTSSAPPWGVAPLRLRAVGVGGAGGRLVDAIYGATLPGVECAVVNTDAVALAGCATPHKVQLGPRLTRGLGAGGDAKVGQAAAEQSMDALRGLCQGADLVILLAGLGGGTGSGAGPVVAQMARDAGALVLGVVTLPFACEGDRCHEQTARCRERLRTASDGLLYLSNQTIGDLVEQGGSLVHTYALSNEMILECVRGLWRLVMCPGLLNADFAHVRRMLRNQHAEGVFATAESRGADRAARVVDDLRQSPLLQGGRCLTQARAILVSLRGGADLGLTEIGEVKRALQTLAPRAQLELGASVELEQEDRLAVTVIASIPAPEANPAQDDEGSASVETADPSLGPSVADRLEAGEVETGFFRSRPTPRPPSKFVAPAPDLTDAQKADMFARQGSHPRRGKRGGNRWRQGVLPLEIMSKGRFEKSEPTIYKGEDLDVPTFIRRGIVLN